MSSSNNFSTHTNRIFYNYHRAPEYNYSSNRFYSSLQSHRSRVFARKEERLPTVSRQFNPGGGRFSEPLRNAQEAIRLGTSLFSAPQPAGKVTTANHLPVLSQEKRSPKHPPRNASKNQRGEASPSRLLGSHIAGMSSKEQDDHVVKVDKMASGWAEVRAGHSIPHLRDPQQEAEKSPRDQQKDHSPTTGRNTTVDKHPSRALKSNMTMVSKEGPHIEPDSRSNKENMNKKPQEEVIVTDNHDKAKTTTKKPTAHTAKPKGSSGYGSMSSGSGSQQGEPVVKKRSVAKAPHYDSVFVYNGGDKRREVASIYTNRVKVEDRSHVVGENAAEKEHVLTEKEAHMYTHLKSTYRHTGELEREKRKEIFFRKLQDVQIDAALQHNKEVQLRAAKKEQAKRRQLEQLKHIRDKFEQERLKRYRSQYITKNFLNYERMDRKEYGLPEHHMKKTEYEAKLKRTGGTKVTALAFLKREVKLKKNYVKMFREPSAAQNLVSKPPKMEGKDQVTLEVTDARGKSQKGKKVDVKSEIKEAKLLVKDIAADVEDDRMAAAETEKDKQTHDRNEPTKAKQSAVHQPAAAKPVQTKEKPSQARPEIKIRHASTTSDPVPAANQAPQESMARQTIARLEEESRQRSAAQAETEPAAAGYVIGSSLGKPAAPDTLSVSSRISAITEDSEGGVDFYEKLMAKYGIEMSDDDDDELI